MRAFFRLPFDIGNRCLRRQGQGCFSVAASPLPAVGRRTCSGCSSPKTAVRLMGSAHPPLGFSPSKGGWGGGWNKNKPAQRFGSSPMFPRLQGHPCLLLSPVHPCKGEAGTLRQDSGHPARCWAARHSGSGGSPSPTAPAAPPVFPRCDGSGGTAASVPAL